MTPHSAQHYHQLRQALTQEMQRVPAKTSGGLPMKKFIPWLVAMPVAASALAGVLFFQQSSNTITNANLASLNLGDFMSAAQAATEEHPNKVLHQKISEQYYIGDALTHTILETWHGQQNYADQQLSADGDILERYLEVTDATTGQRRGYELHAEDPITTAVIPEDHMDEDNTVCGLNPNDFPALSFNEQIAELARITGESHNINERIAMLQTMIQQGNVTDLGVRDGKRGLEIKAHSQTFQYWFDASTFALKTYKEFDAHGAIRRESDYLVDEYLSTPEEALSIFQDTAGLTEIHLYNDFPSLGLDFFNTHPTGCYNSAGERMGDVDASVNVDTNGDVTVTYQARPLEE